MASKRKLYFVLVERDDKLSIQSVRVFKGEADVWTAYEVSNACYATVHASTMQWSTKLSYGQSEILETRSENRE